MKPTERSDGRWMVRIPRKLSRSGRRESRYFPSKNQAEKFIKEFKSETLEHGRSGVSSDERQWINFARNQIGNLDLLPEVISHYQRTAVHLSPITAGEAVKLYIQSAEAEYPNRRTFNDVRERAQAFSNRYGPRKLHEIRPDELEGYLSGFSAGWLRWSVYKRLKPFFKYAKRRRWVTIDPTTELIAPKTPAASREIYTPRQFQWLLYESEKHYPDLLPFVVLAGFCYLRTSELVRKYAREATLQWSDIHWRDGLIHVRPGVAKGTRRHAGDERFTPLSDTAKEWLAPIRKTSGPCVPIGHRKFGELWRAMTDLAKVPRVDNGLRHSAISYALAADPELGIVQVARYAGNSEKTVRKHYLRLLKPEQGLEWFGVMHSDAVDAIIAEQEAARQQPGYDPDAF
jgi:integrase